MLLAIDIGNTNIVIGCMKDDEIVFKARIATDRLRTSDQYGVEIKNMIEAFGVNLKNLHIQPLEEWAEKRACRYGYLHRWILLLESSERVTEHSHIAHSRETHHSNMFGQVFELSLFSTFDSASLSTAYFHKVRG